MEVMNCLKSNSVKLIWTNLHIIVFSFKYSSFVLLKIVHMVAREKHVPIN